MADMAGALRKRRRKLLVVEADRQFCAILCDFLEAQKFDIATAHSADEALKKLDSASPDLMLLSRELPLSDGNIGPDGLRVLKVIKQDLRLKVPVILVAENATEKDFDRYRKLKFTADDYLTKPFEDTEILRRIENLVGFDISDDLGSLKDKLGDIGDDPMANIFDADPEELGISSSRATRAEVARLLEQVGQELDRHESELLNNEEEPAAAAKPAANGGTEKEAGRLRQEIQSLKKQLDLAQKQLVTERKRSREIKKEWKRQLQEISEELEKSEEREARMTSEFETIRLRLADMELDHTMEMERVQSEKRRMEEDLQRLRALDYPPEKAAGDLREVAEALVRIIARFEEPTES